MTASVSFGFGQAFVGDIFNVLLTGIVIVQAHIYFTTYKDRVWMRLLVLIIITVDTINTTLNVIYLYHSLITNFGDFEILLKVNSYMILGKPYLGLSSYMTMAHKMVTTARTDPGTVGLMVQLLFAWRIHILTRCWALVLAVVTLACTGAVGAFITAHKILIDPEFARFHELKKYVSLWLACTSAGDIVIATILVWFLVHITQLLRRKNKTGFKESDMMIDRIVRVIMQTGLLTSIVAIIELLVFVLDSTALLVLFNIPLCKLYSISLLSSLNLRRDWGDSDSDRETAVGTFVTNTFPFQTQLDAMHSE
ncbi:hypothetical protein P691DRAFT_766281 [Macrolepiota fuliginosa MF-IS2]|uniref:DUF6534 domain-containing protein n=1 Tax=Macrolepiota fuliginosa MF-IS2 TaxID=1400762 RepID=A0A9P6BXG7_9AGAR|nr:hypothetical protein P691DRAFT_766281 [Macrolepiota fuliginosa MF-IS2]